MFKYKANKVILTILLIAAIISSIAGYIYSSFLGKIKKVEIPKDNTPPEIIVEEPKKEKNKIDKEIVNILFFGLDRRNPNEASRTDCIMIISIDESRKKIKASSLMRDMYVPISGRESNRINAAYAFGGADLAIKTVNTNFGLDIDKFVTVDFIGLEKLIDMIGGVEVNVSKAEAKILNSYIKELNYLNSEAAAAPYINSGINLLNGRQAVAYSRIRYVGNGDYERTQRQREVLNQIFKKLKAQGITKIPSTISKMLPYVETNLSNMEILNFALDAMKFDTENIEQFRVPVDGTFKSQSIRGMAVLVPDLEENKRRLKEFIYGK
ncbi:transcriptional attenuator, LytR family [Caloramator quimbayensis]|uniref:Transcriptional attenuator, LytR family n=1 Tax=Caloramator quimbayensis TaxID=1147123 RepID=A0A1T4XGY5_9CLOT|nr:LCP family protein [Caloramator quimbayensis]SKA88800.1 transcriptional attenuator, LytR family [Caloramator quimbayensis]